MFNQREIQFVAISSGCTLVRLVSVKKWNDRCRFKIAAFFCNWRNSATALLMEIPDQCGF
jgi:hypothetical protein